MAGRHRRCNFQFDFAFHAEGGRLSQAMGGITRVGQVQLLQPFLTLIGALLILGEPLKASHVLFAFVIIAIVAIGRRVRIRR